MHAHLVQLVDVPLQVSFPPHSKVNPLVQLSSPEQLVLLRVGPEYVTVPQGVVLGAKVLVGQASLTPSQVSVTSQVLTAARQTVPAPAARTGQVTPPVQRSSRSQTLEPFARQTVPEAST